jgi:hypothetical protein
MTAWEWHQVELTCNGGGCGKRFVGDRGLRPQTGESVSMVRKRAAKAGWTMVRTKTGVRGLNLDFCPDHGEVKNDVPS